MIDMVLSEDPFVVEAIEHIKNQFMDNKFYNLIANKLGDMRRGRKSFFEQANRGFLATIFNREERKKLKSFAARFKKKGENLGS